MDGTSGWKEYDGTGHFTTSSTQEPRGLTLQRVRWHMGHSRTTPQDSKMAQGKRIEMIIILKRKQKEMSLFTGKMKETILF